MWALVADGSDTPVSAGYANTDHAILVLAEQPSVGAPWRVRLYFLDGRTAYLKATYASQAEAVEAADLVVGGVDPTATE